MADAKSPAGSTQDRVPDSPLPDSIGGGLVERAPVSLRPFMRLARWDRPVGAWLLALPGFAGVALAGVGTGYVWSDPILVALIFIGAFAMRGAGCTYNDIVDRDLDRRVARTAGRPVASGAVSLRAAWAFIALQCVAGLIVLLLLPRTAQIVALLSIPLVAAYPFMKRITWWPQAWLGLTFNWPVLVGYAAGAERIDAPALILYAALILWTLGYDTIYAMQDREDDALAGVKSSARALGAHAREGVAVFYGASAVVAALAAAVAANAAWAAAAALPYAVHLFWQGVRMRGPDRDPWLRLFRSNRSAGLLLFAGLVLLGLLMSLIEGRPPVAASFRP